MGLNAMPRLILPPKYERPQVQYYPDTNFLGFADAYKLLLSLGSCRLLDSTMREVLAKRDHRVESLLNKLLPQAHIADEQYFRNVGSVSTLRLVQKCARTLAPEVYGAIRQLEDERPIPEGRMEAALRAIDEGMRERVKKIDDARIAQLHAEYTAHNPENPLPQERPQHRRRLHSAWYQYHKKRFRALSAGTYTWTDEDLCAAAVADAFLRDNMSVIISADKDFYVIMKQFTDNLLMAYSVFMSLKETGTEDNKGVYFEREVEIIEKLRRDVLHTKQDNALVLDVEGLSAMESDMLKRYFLPESGMYLKGTVVLFDWWTSQPPCPYHYPAHIVHFAKNVRVTTLWTPH